LTGSEPFAAVHYRGSDKFLEDHRVSKDAVLRALEDEMKRDALSRVFVASDEPAFIRAAKERFGRAAFWLPYQATAVDGRPPHFAEISGEVKAREALVTMVALSRANLCIRTPSFLSAWSHTLTTGQRTRIIQSRT
jgi:hypothetical protein